MSSSKCFPRDDSVIARGLWRKDARARMVPLRSFPRTREPRCDQQGLWIPACAGMSGEPVGRIQYQTAPSFQTTSIVLASASRRPEVCASPLARAEGSGAPGGALYDPRWRSAARPIRPDAAFRRSTAAFLSAGPYFRGPGIRALSSPLPVPVQPSMGQSPRSGARTVTHSLPSAGRRSPPAGAALAPSSRRHR
jgi:hypothetical protein